MKRYSDYCKSDSFCIIDRISTLTIEFWIAVLKRIYPRQKKKKQSAERNFKLIKITKQLSAAGKSKMNHLIGDGPLAKLTGVSKELSVALTSLRKGLKKSLMNL